MLAAEAIIQEAQVRAGFEDRDTFARDNLDALVESLNAEAALSPGGAENAHKMLVRDAANRIEGLRWLARYPDVSTEAIDAPIFLMGLPRSGTTFFQYLFDCDSRLRLIRSWESFEPNPPAGADPAAATARRERWAQQRRKMVADIQGLEAMHLFDEDGSEECHAFLEQSFSAAGLNNIYHVPAFFDYLVSRADLLASYRVHKRQLQLLQWGGERKPWALKYPNHVLAIPQIAEVYPDARFVMTHRDPVQVLASISKLTWALRKAHQAVPQDKTAVARDMTVFIQRHVDRILAVDRSALGSRVVHVDYYALVSDPVAVMKQVHRKLGMESPAAVQQSVRAWHHANPRNSRGANEYGLQEYGLERGALMELFGDYIRRFDIPNEAQGLAPASDTAG